MLFPAAMCGLLQVGRHEEKVPAMLMTILAKAEGK